MAPTSTCRTSVGVAVLGGYLYAVGGQDGVSCLNIVERYQSKLSCIGQTCCLGLALTLSSFSVLQLTCLDMHPLHIQI